MFLFARGLKVYLSQTEKSCAHTLSGNTVCECRMQHPEIGTRNLIPALEMLKSLWNTSGVPCSYYS